MDDADQAMNIEDAATDGGDHPIFSNMYGGRLCAQLGLDPSKTRRVIIDICVGQPVKIYVEQVGSGHQMLNLEIPTPEFSQLIINGTPQDMASLSDAWRHIEKPVAEPSEG